MITREGIPVAAVCDGAGNAEQAARQVLKLFQLFIREATLGKILAPKAWISWTRQLDSALLGGSESTFLAVAVVGDQVVGASAGDSQAYLLGAEGGVQFLTASADKAQGCGIRGWRESRGRRPDRWHVAASSSGGVRSLSESR